MFQRVQRQSRNSANVRDKFVPPRQLFQALCEVEPSTMYFCIALIDTIFYFQKKQQSNLLELVKNTEGFANVHEDAKGLQVEKTMKQVTNS